MIADNYQFYLSFESAHCKDYITEKFYLPLYHGVLPIVYGGSSRDDYKAIAPPNSYIDTRDFDSPKLLAEFLLKLNASKTHYEQFFMWRKNYTLQVDKSFIGQDILCKKLWNLDKFKHSFTNKVTLSICLVFF